MKHGVRWFLSALLFSRVVFSPDVFAVQFEFIGVGSQVIYQGEAQADLKQSVGAFTIEVLKKAQSEGILKFVGSERALMAINDLKHDGLDDYEVISNEKMKAYGWCYTVDGQLSEKLPNETYFQSNSDVLRWYYAYAYYDREWVSFCVPVDKPRKP